jgi:hypothetical protein
LLELERWDDAQVACELGFERTDDCLDEDHAFALMRIYEEAGRARGGR